jgi:hypothetical protein
MRAPFISAMIRERNGGFMKNLNGLIAKLDPRPRVAFR